MSDTPSDPPFPRLSIVPGKSDTEAAAEIRESMKEAIKPVMEELGKAKRLGFDVSFNVSIDATGRPFLQMLRITKEY